MSFNNQRVSILEWVKMSKHYSGDVLNQYFGNK